jgi:hypothetical protein
VDQRHVHPAHARRARHRVGASAAAAAIRHSNGHGAVDQPTQATSQLVAVFDCPGSTTKVDPDNEPAAQPVASLGAYPVGPANRLGQASIFKKVRFANSYPVMVMC